MHGRVNTCCLAVFALLSHSAVIGGFCHAHTEPVPWEQARQSVLTLLDKSYGNVLSSSSIVVEATWIVSFRDDLSMLAPRREVSHFGRATDERDREIGTSWVRGDSDWRREAKPSGVTQGPIALITSVSICAADYVLDSRSLHCPLLTLQYQTDDRIGKRGLSANSVLNTGLVARVLRDEIKRGTRFTVHPQHSTIGVFSVEPGELDIVLDAQTGAIRSLSTRMSPDVQLEATYLGSLAESTYPAPQPMEMLLLLRSRAETSAVTCSRFRFLRAAIADERPGRFEWADVAPLAHWQGSDSVFKKDGSVDAGASTRLALHNAELAKPAREQFEYSMGAPPKLIDRTIDWRMWILSIGIGFLATAGLIARRRK